MLRGGIRTEERQRALARDRADEDDPSMRAPQVRQERLRDGDLADDVDIELAPELLQGDELERHRNRDAGVVDESIEPVDPLRRGANLLLARDVEQDLLAAARRVARAADSCENAPTVGDEPCDASRADPGGCARHERGAHQSSSQAATFARCSRA
jgi:hypothetical protein